MRVNPFTKDRTLVRDVREAAGLRQAEAARRIGMPKTQLGNYELGRYWPRDETLARILEELAAGARADDEERPALLIAYPLGGTRLLADESGAVWTFHDPRRAEEVADDVHDLVPGAHVVAVWHDKLRELTETHGHRVRYADDSGEEDPVAPLRAWLREALEEFEAMQREDPGGEPGPLNPHADRGGGSDSEP